MSLVVLGQSAGPTQLSANDDVFGLMTQVPEGAVKHSPGGLTGATGNTAFGAPFTLLTYFTTSAPSGGAETLTKALANADCPYKLRVLKARVTMIDEANGRLREAANSCSVSIDNGDYAMGAVDISDMRQLEERNVVLNRIGNEEVDTDNSLQVQVHLRLGETGVTDTLTLLVELVCMRVI